MESPKCLNCSGLVNPDKKRDRFKNRKYCSKTCQGKAAQERYWRKKLSYESKSGEIGPSEVRP